MQARFLLVTQTGRVFSCGVINYQNSQTMVAAEYSRFFLNCVQVADSVNVSGIRLRRPACDT